MIYSTSTALDSSRQQSAADGASLDTKFRSYVCVGSACAVLSQDVVNVHRLVRLRNWRGWSRALGSVAATVFGLRHQLQVGQVIVEGVAVDVMNDLPSLKRSSQMLSHDDSVLIGQASINADHAVAERLMNVPALITRVFGSRPFAWLDAVAKAAPVSGSLFRIHGFSPERLVSRGRRAVLGEQVRTSNHFHFLAAENTFHVGYCSKFLHHSLVMKGG